MLWFIKFLRKRNVNVDAHLRTARKLVNGKADVKGSIVRDKRVLKSLKATSKFMDKRGR